MSCCSRVAGNPDRAARMLALAGATSSVIGTVVVYAALGAAETPARALLGLTVAASAVASVVMTGCVCVSAVVGIRRSIERLAYALGRRDEWISIESGSRHCAGCAYDLQGLPLGVRCPECGSRTMG